MIYSARILARYLLDRTFETQLVLFILPNQSVRNQWNYQEKMEWHCSIEARSPTKLKWSISVLTKTLITAWQSRIVNANFWKWKGKFFVGPDWLVKEDHLWRWTTLTGKFPHRPKHSIYFSTKISENFGLMESTQRMPKKVWYKNNTGYMTRHCSPRLLNFRPIGLDLSPATILFPYSCVAKFFRG